MDWAWVIIRSTSANWFWSHWSHQFLILLPSLYCQGYALRHLRQSHLRGWLVGCGIISSLPLLLRQFDRGLVICGNAQNNSIHSIFHSICFSSVLYLMRIIIVTASISIRILIMRIIMASASSCIHTIG